MPRRRGGGAPPMPMVDSSSSDDDGGSEDDYSTSEYEDHSQDEDEDEQLDEPPPQEEEPPSPPPPTPASSLPCAAADAETASTSYSASQEDDLTKWTRDEFDGLFCPICMEPWTSSGDHQPSCLSCGHLFGMSCIKKWLGLQKTSGKCPQCNKRCTLKDVRRIYGARVVEVDEESQKRIRLLEAKCNTFEEKDEEWQRKEIQWRMQLIIWQKKEAEWRQRFENFNKRTSNLERTVEELGKMSSFHTAANGFYGLAAEEHEVRSNYYPGYFSSFSLQQELRLEGARYFDVDDAGQMLVVARRSTQIGGSQVLTKMSLVSTHEQDDILLPSAIKTVRDLHVSRSGRLALLASMGKKLSVVSMESNSIVINYDLPVAAWSCSWDINNSNYVYAGLQNGMVLVFDLRRTERPLESRIGLSSNPVHTIYSLLQDQSDHLGNTGLLTASSVGLCHWSIGGTNVQPSVITETTNQGVCISVAYCHKSGNIVATYRPKVEMPDDVGSSQMSQTPSFNVDHHVSGSHVLFKRVNSVYQNLGSMCAYVPGIRLPKSTILDIGNHYSLFACGDGSVSSLALQELPSFKVAHCLQSTQSIRDVKFTSLVKPGLLCCLSEDRVQLFSQKS